MMQYAESKYEKVEVAKFISNEVDFKMETITGEKKRNFIIINIRKV